MVVMFALGIPAREASGFAPGDYDPSTSEWTIRESAAHAWPEVYFPDAGWVQFEPTPSQTIIQRPDSAEAGDTSLTPTAALTAAPRPTHSIRGDEEDTPTPAPDPAATTGADGGAGGAGGLGWESISRTGAS